MTLKMDETVRVSGVVINSKIGQVKLSRKLGASDTFKSIEASKYSDNDLIELIFKSPPNNPDDKKLVRINKLDVNDRYFVALTYVENIGFENSIVTIEHLANLLQLTYEGTKELKDKIFSQNTSTFQVILQSGLAYDEAWDLRDSLSDSCGNDVRFNVVKHTPENMPKDSIYEELEWVGDHWIHPSLRLMFKSAQQTLKQGKIINMLLKGESGYGKTSTFKAVADWLGVECIYINCASLQDTEQWFGYYEARDGSTFFDPTEFTKAIRKGNCVVILDEFNRIEPWLHNSLMPILDHRRETTIHGENIKVGAGTIFAATINEGGKYSGTNTIDAAMLNRFDIAAEVTAPPSTVEVDILVKKFGTVPKVELVKIVSTVNDLRKMGGDYGLTVDVSTRSCEKMANLISLGLTPRQAAQYVITYMADMDERKGILDIVNMKLGVDLAFS